MIARLTGVVEQADDGSVLLAMASGAAYEVLVPAYLAPRLERAGSGGGAASQLTLHTLEYLESQNQGSSFIPRLIGFASPIERDFFELLTSVKGLGNKRALRAMASEPSMIARAIHDRDTRALQRLPEIGPKLAELIVHELKNKVERFLVMSALATAAAPPAAAAPAGADAEVEPKSPKSKPRVRLGEPGTPAPATPSRAEAAPTPPIRQTIETLIALGEAPFEAERLVARAIDRARAAGSPPPATAHELVAAAYAAR